MVTAIALHSVIPLRSEPKETAEQTTQMLFAQTADVLEEQARWTHIRLHTDGQEGWADKKMLTPLSEREWDEINHDAHLTHPTHFLPITALPLTYAVSENNGQTLPLTAGTRLYQYQDGRFNVLGVHFRIDPQAVLTHPLPLTQENLMQVVRFFLNIPYLWGGKNALGMDCSGFTQTIYSLFGISLPRNAGEQAALLRSSDSRFHTLHPVLSLTHAQPGDIAFFDHTSSQQPNADLQPHISHVGILLDPQRIIHCSGRVKVERIDEKGILSHEIIHPEHPDGHYTHRLIQIGRPTPTTDTHA